MADTHISMCKVCPAYCPIEVTVEGGRAVKVVGDRQSPLYKGYTCPKGRALPEAHNHPDRLLQSQKRQADGSFQPIATATAVDEISVKLKAIIDKYGPESVAVFPGNGTVNNPVNISIAVAFLNALGTGLKRFFSVQTIDQPGKVIAQALHGKWIAGPHPFHQSDTWVLVGANPVISKMGLGQNPAQIIKEAVNNGMQLIVIDPRETESAKKACLHLQPQPGQDPTLLAGFLHIILNEELYDKDFVASNAQGLAKLQAAVQPFTPDYVSEVTGVPVEKIREAVLIFTAGKRGSLVTGTGPHFALHGTLLEYLALCINTLCGRWVREGERNGHPHVMLPDYQPKAQPMPPYKPWDETQPGRLYGLPTTIMGAATGTLADEILTPGDGQIRALFCAGSNPMVSLPDQVRTLKGFKDLELLVSLDVEMSNTARVAHYVIPDYLGLETPAVSQFLEASKYYGLWTQGLEWPYAMYSSAVVKPPQDSDVIEIWQFFYELCKKMGLPLTMYGNAAGVGQHWDKYPEEIKLDMSKRPETEEMVQNMCIGSRVPLEKVKQYPHGKIYDELDHIVLPRDIDCVDYFELADKTMLDELQTVFERRGDLPQPNNDFPLLLVARRTNEVLNSIGRTNPKLGGKRPSNPVYINPLDMDKYGIQSGATITLCSSFGEVIAIAQAEKNLRPGTVSMSHCFGGNPDEIFTPEEQGACTSRLMSADPEHIDPLFGQPRMSAIPVMISAV
jgi:anaerobic selenocysteine-containing dehydrogenase